MNLYKLLSHTFKTIILLLIFIIFGLIISRFGICKTMELSNSSDLQNKAELKEGNLVNVVPYTKGALKSISTASVTKGSKLEQTVKGLKDAGYSLDEITVILKNDKNDASTVGIACLKQGYPGQQIYKSLLKSGYSKNNADQAVSLSIRQEDQFSAAAPSEVLGVPVSIGVTFNGLSNWGEFQNDRFEHK